MVARKIISLFLVFMIFLPPTQGWGQPLEDQAQFYLQKIGPGQSPSTQPGQLPSAQAPIRTELPRQLPTAINDAPFLNLFDEPTYFLGLPFDLSFILPEQAIVSPESIITVTVRNYNSSNTLGTTFTAYVDVDSLEGFINSLTIDPTVVDADAVYLTIEITV